MYIEVKVTAHLASNIPFSVGWLNNKTNVQDVYWLVFSSVVERFF